MTDLTVAMSLALPDYNVGSKPGHQIATELLRRYLPKLLTENNVSTFLSAISTATAPAPRLSGFRYVAGYGGNGKKTAFSTMVLFKSQVSVKPLSSVLWVRVLWYPIVGIYMFVLVARCFAQESGDEYALLICKSAMKEPDAAKATIAVILGMFMSFALCEQKALYDRRLMTDIIMPVLQDDRITQRMLYISTGSTVQLPTIVQLLGAFGMADYPYESLLIKPQVELCIVQFAMYCADC